MRNTQTKFTAALRALAESHGFELVVNTQWANTGTFRVEATDSFVPVLSMSYGFYDGYASFDNVTPDIGDRSKMLRDYTGGPITPHGTHFPYVKPEELETRVLAAVRKHLSGVAFARRVEA